MRLIPLESVGSNRKNAFDALNKKLEEFELNSFWLIKDIDYDVLVDAGNVRIYAVVKVTPL